MVKKILYRKKSNDNKKNKLAKANKYYVKDLEKDYHTDRGFVKSADLKKEPGTKISTDKNTDFFLLEPTLKDIYEKIKRGAQIIPLKDIGTIITETGINKDSFIVDSGSGSGGLSLFLASIAKKVSTYDIREDFIEIVKKNIDFLGLKNIKVKNMDFYEGVPDKNADVVTLDLPEPWKAIDSAASCLKIGGYLVVYNPSIPQISDFVDAIKKDERFAFLKAVEINEREWEFEGRKVRPISKTTIHSGFLAFSRLITKDIK